MDKRPDDVRRMLEAQLRHQVRITRKRMTWWMPLIFAAGLCVSILGLIPAATVSLEGEAPKVSLFVYGIFALFFAWAVISAAVWPVFLRPRIVPYFNRELEPYGGTTMAAFLRGQALYREIAALEAAAGRLCVRPLSAFGFTHDLYEEAVQWHRASDGLRTVAALRQEIEANSPPDLVQDLDALAAILRVADGRNIEFSLVLRLHAKDNMQGVCTREVRQGSYW